MKQIEILKAYDELLDSGFTKDQAKAQINVLDSALINMATKQDLQNLKSELQISFAWELGIVLLAVWIFPAMSERIKRRKEVI